MNKLFNKKIQERYWARQPFLPQGAQDACFAMICEDLYKDGAKNAREITLSEVADLDYQLLSAAKALRLAQREYMANRHNELYGMAVAARAKELDDAIAAFEIVTR